MAVMKTPGVYIVEKNAFPNSVVEVATAVPAFIGYTEKADNKGSSLSRKPWRISSMSEFVNYFGNEPEDKFKFTRIVAPDSAAATTRPLPESDFKCGADGYTLERARGEDTSRYYLYYSMQLFFQNGGGPCYIVSVGSYGDPATISKTDLQDGIDLLLKEQEPTMVVIPDAMALAQDACIALQQHSLEHCGLKMKNRFAILDISHGYRDLNDSTDDSGNCVKKFRNDLGVNYLKYAAAYYPWLNTAIVQPTDLGLDNFGDRAALGKLLLDEAKALALKANQAELGKELTDILAQVAGTPAPAAPAPAADHEADPNAPPAPAPVPAPAAASKLPDDELHKILFAISPTYGNILLAIKRKLNLLPPAAAMAGVYTMVDNTRGVWKAPANVSLASVVSPAVNITHDDQEDLNVTTAGKSINAIRTFIGEGTLVWGARTLDGNSLDWRYINVRRTMIMIEESLRLATKAYVFEPNVSGTWVTIRSMAANFLTSVWKRGGLAGATPEDAFSVNVGLGETMTPEDILEGILRVTILVAVSRPAEFIEITFQQQMQKS